MIMAERSLEMLRCSAVPGRYVLELSGELAGRQPARRARSPRTTAP
jgi:hypothetical protein